MEVLPRIWPAHRRLLLRNLLLQQKRSAPASSPRSWRCCSPSSGAPHTESRELHKIGEDRAPSNDCRSLKHSPRYLRAAGGTERVSPYNRQSTGGTGLWFCAELNGGAKSTRSMLSSARENAAKPAAKQSPAPSRPSQTEPPPKFGDSAQRGGAATEVAQICNLPYRRFATCGACGNGKARRSSHALPNAIRRYSRLKICATGAPDNLRGPRRFGPTLIECNSALRCVRGSCLFC